MSTTSNDTALLTRDELLVWLHEDDPQKLETLWSWADDVRRSCVGDQVHLRGLIEFGNVCRRECLYCGIRKSRSLPRYRMPDAEILACAERAAELGFGTVVLQSGEDAERMDPDAADGLPAFAALIRTIKERLGLAVTLSIGEHTDEVYRTLRDAGADRYLLRFETSDPELYHKHPPADPRRDARIASPCCARCARLGYEVGSGVMVGIPGQSLREILADDLLLTFVELDLDMIGVGPFVPHPDTPLGAHPDRLRAAARRAGARRRDDDLQGPRADAAAAPERQSPEHDGARDGRPEPTADADGLQRGANVVMPNLTPAQLSRVLRDLSEQDLPLTDGPTAVLRGLPERSARDRPRTRRRSPGRSPKSTSRGAEQALRTPSKTTTQHDR
jgi:biotin synthase